jgi:hypothetical protein
LAGETAVDAGADTTANGSTVRRWRQPGATWLVAIAVSVLALAVYRATMLPGLGAWDTGEAQTVPTILGTMHPTGFPAYVVLGFLVTTVLAPIAAASTSMNFLSALLVALAVGTTVFVGRRVGAPPLVAGAVALGFALTPIVWSIAVAADAHALHLALVALVTFGLLRWESLVRAWRAAPDDTTLRRRADRAIVGTAALFGVAVANHALSLLLVPAIGLFVLAVEPRVLRRPRLILAALGASLGVAAILYLQMPLRAGPFRAPLVYGSPDTWEGFWDILLAQQFQGDVGSPLSDLSGKLARLVELTASQFGPLIVFIPAGFLVAVVRYPRYALLSGVAVLVTCFFAASYANAAIDRYYLGPVFFAWTWIAALGGALVARILGTDVEEDEEEGDADGEALAPVPAMTRTALPLRILVPALVGIALLVPTAAAFRERWVETDHSRVTWVSAWLDEAFETMEQDAVVISWWSYSTPMWYGQHVEGRRPDIRIVDDRTRLDENLGEVADVIEANLDTRPVYLMRVAESQVQELADRYTIEPAGRPGNLFRVTGRQESTP